MKKLVFASAMAIASLGLVCTPALNAQAAGGGQINLPAAEYNAYQTATTETNPTAKAAALEGFLQTYPQSPVKNEVLDQLMDTYRQLGDLDKELSACNRLLQIEPNNLKALLYSVLIKKSECAKTVNASGVSSDPQTCDDAAALAQKGLAAPKPANVDDAQWKQMTDVAFPMFHSAIALDYAVSKKDYANAIKEYTQELMLYPAQATESGPGLVDTLALAQAYTKSGVQDLPKAVWFYARVWNFAPPAYQAQIEPQLEYWYKRYHGGTDGLNAVKAQAKTTVFPPADFKIAPAPTPADVAAKVVATTPDLTKLNLDDKEYILANGNPADAQKLWSVLQGQVTPVPGIVTSVTSTAMDVHVYIGPRLVRDFTVNLNNPMPAAQIRAVPNDVQQQENFIMTNGVPADTAKLEPLFKTEGERIRKIELEPNASVIEMAVSQDAKNNNKADFIVNLKKPVVGKDVPAPGFEYKFLPDPELDGTYSSYKPIPPATKGGIGSAQIVLSDGFVQVIPPKKEAPARRAPVRRRPATH